MVKEKYLECIEKSFTDVGVQLTNTFNTCISKAAENSAEITKDVAIKFAEYILDNGYQGCTFGWSDNQCLTKITTEELFEQFLKEIEL